MKVLMVCLGNICRSPLAEGILSEKVKSKTGWEIASAGISGYHVGDRPDARAVQTGKKYGIDITGQSARQFHPSDFETYDLIYAVDRSVYDKLVSIASNQSNRNKVKLLLNELMPGSDADIPDPYYGGDEGFENVFQLIDQATDKIVEKYSK
jgi:protein-tyrosine phosphatase